ncbi:MAG: radical SAM protein [Candidatus Melainabacteria bacterium]|nr:radical SAM protein [Candidatus Melainabacteria bacterium]
MSRPVAAKETYLYQAVPPQANALRVGWAYPAGYNIAMSALGWLLLFRQLDQNPSVAVQRITTDTPAGHIAKDLALFGLSLAWELDLAGVMTLLENARIPLWSHQRTQEHPLVFAGGPVATTNPEPYADFFDFFLIGDGEDVLEEVVSACQNFSPTQSRQERLLELAQIEGVYVPSLYQVHYASAQGEILSIEPRSSQVPTLVQRRNATDLANRVAASPILTEDTVFSNTFLVEVMRGCAHRCRFCLASYSNLPARGSDLTPLIAVIEQGLAHTRKLGLLGALIADHPEFESLCDFLNRQDNLELSASSLRADTLTEGIAQTFVRGGQRQLTLAIESGSPTLRRRINKHLKQEAIFQAAMASEKAGLKGLKLYGMVGLPDETDEDVAQTIALFAELKKVAPKLKWTLGCSTFVPKAATPFQWMARPETRLLEARQEALRKGLLKRADFRPSSPKWDTLQALLSRGDRRLSALLVKFQELGGKLGSLNRAYKALEADGIQLPSLEWYAHRARPESEVLPWDRIHLGVPKAILWKEAAPPPNALSNSAQGP